VARTHAGERFKLSGRTALARSKSVTPEATPNGGKAPARRTWLPGRGACLHQRTQVASLYTRAAEKQKRCTHGRCLGCTQPWEEQACPASLRKKVGEAPPTAGFFAWLPELPAPGRPGTRAPRGLAAALIPKNEPLDPERRAALAIVAVDRDIANSRAENHAGPLVGRSGRSWSRLSISQSSI
jgi:hypothetical protein